MKTKEKATKLVQLHLKVKKSTYFALKIQAARSRTTISGLLDDMCRVEPVRQTVVRKNKPTVVLQSVNPVRWMTVYDLYGFEKSI